MEFNTSELKEWGMADALRAARWAIRKGKLPSRRAFHLPGRPYLFTDEEVLHSHHEPLIQALPQMKSYKAAERPKGSPPPGMPFFEDRPAPVTPPPPPDPGRLPNTSSLQQWGEEAKQIWEELDALPTPPATPAPSDWVPLITAQMDLLEQLIDWLMGSIILIANEHPEGWVTLWRQYATRLTQAREKLFKP